MQNHIQSCEKKLSNKSGRLPKNASVHASHREDPAAAATAVPGYFEAAFGQGMEPAPCTPRPSPQLSNHSHMGADAMDELQLPFSPLQPGRATSRGAGSPLPPSCPRTNADVSHYHASSSEAGVSGFGEASNRMAQSPRRVSASARASSGGGACRGENDAAMQGVRGPVQLNLPRLHPDAVQAIVEYHYLGKVTINGLDALLALAAAVHELQVESMVELVTRKIIESVNAETCVAIMQRTPREWKEPFHVTFRFALAKFELVAQSSSFLKLDVNRLEELLKHDGLCVASEYDLYQHTVRWMCSDDPDIDAEVDGFFCARGECKEECMPWQNFAESYPVPTHRPEKAHYECVA